MLGVGVEIFLVLFGLCYEATEYLLLKKQQLNIFTPATDQKLKERLHIDGPIEELQ